MTQLLGLPIIYKGQLIEMCIHFFIVRSLGLYRPCGDFPLDENVITHFPEGTRVSSADRYGSPTWTITAHITTELADGTPKKYFIKCATEGAGRAMMEGEYWARTEL